MKKARSQTAAVPVGTLPTVNPEVGSYGLPVGFVIAIALLIYLGQAEGCLNHGLFSAGVYEPYADLAGIPKAGGEVDPVAEGRVVYQSAGCVACHQPNGTGNPANGCPPLAESDWVLAEGPARLIRIVLHGARGEFVVSQQKWNSPAGMTPFGSILSDEQIAHVLTYIRNEWGNKALPVPPELVRSVREKTATRNSQWTAPELEKLPTTE